MQFARKKGFTFVEIVLIIFVLSVAITGIMIALNRGIGFIQKIKQRVVAINLARQGMEEMYNIRDTNRQRRAGKRDECRLKMDPLNDGGNGICDDDNWVQSGFYILLSKKNNNGQKYFFLSGPFLDNLDFSGGIDTGELIYSLCQSGSVWTECPGQRPDGGEGNYRRQISVKGLFLKDENISGGQVLTCINGNDSVDCGNARAKELRFCSRVGFQGEGFGMIELCGVMTNYLE